MLSRVCAPVVRMDNHCYVVVGRMILSGGSDGLIAVSSRTTGMTVRVMSDQQGAPVTGIDVQPSPVCALWCFCYSLPASNVGKGIIFLGCSIRSSIHPVEYCYHNIS